MTTSKNIEPLREPEIPGEGRKKLNEKLIQQYLQIMNLESQKTALRKYSAYLEAMIEKLATDIAKKGGQLAHIHIDPTTGEVTLEIEEGTSIRWETSQELQKFFLDLEENISSGDAEKTLNTLLDIAKMQVDPKQSAHPSYQKAFNRAMTEIFQGEGGKQKGQTEEYTLKLLMSQWGSQVVKKWNMTLPGMQLAALDKLEDQIATTDENATPFKAAAETLSSEMSEMGESELKNFISEDTQKQTKNILLKMITEAMMSPGIKSALHSAGQSLSKESSETEKPKAEEEMSIRVKGHRLFKLNIVDPIYEQEINGIRAAIEELEKSPDTEINKEKLAKLKEALKDIASEYPTRLNTARLYDLLKEIGNLMNLQDVKPPGKMEPHKQKALLILDDVLKRMDKTAHGKLDELEKIVKDLTDKIDSTANIDQLVNETNALLTKGDSMTRDDYAKLMEKYLQLSKASVSNLPKELQQKVQDIKSAISNATVQSPYAGRLPLLYVMASSYLAQKMPQSAANMDEWINEMKNHVRDLKNQFPEAQKAIKALEDILISSAPGPDGHISKIIDPYSGNALFVWDPKTKSYQVNKDFANNKNIKIDNYSDLVAKISDTAGAIHVLRERWIIDRDIKKQAAQQIKDLAGKTGEIQKLLDMFESNMEKSITDMFVDVIIGRYTGFLQLQLKMLALQLNTRTFASRAFSDAGSKITDWANINNTTQPPTGLGFDSWFQNYLTTHPDQKDKPFTKEQMADLRKMAQKEIDKLDQLSGSGKAFVTEMEKKIKETQDKIDKGEISEAEGKKLQDEMRGKIEGAQKVMTNMEELKKSLKEFQEKLDDKNPPTRETLIKSVEVVGKNETTVVNGKKDADHPEKNSVGISTFLENEIMQTAKNYASQGEILQIKLGQSFTNMQMIYTSITECIRIINRMNSTSIGSLANK